MLEKDEDRMWGQPVERPSQQFLPAHEEFQLLLRQAWPSPDAEQATTEAFSAYAAILGEPWQSADLNKRLTEAYAVFHKRVQEAFSGGNSEQVMDAYRRYVRNVKKIWTGLDPESIGPEDLAAIAQGMSWVAGVAGEVSAVHDPMSETQG